MPNELKPDTKNLYWCHGKDDYCGLWVVATSRGRAKDFYSAETETDFLDVRCDLHKKNVGNVAEGCVDAFDEKMLKKLGVEYVEDDDEY